MKRFLIGAILLVWIILVNSSDAAKGNPSSPDSKGRGKGMVPGQHFVVVSEAKSPSPSEIRTHLERTWRVFRDLFGVEPPPVKVVLSLAAGAAQGGSRADQGNTSPQEKAPGEESLSPGGHVIAWTISEGEDLTGQGFSDLSHEIAHIYFLELMGNPQGLHQPHAWLHEAVACYHEGERFIANRERWIRDHIRDRIPLEELFRIKNPVKSNPLVELTVQLHEKLAKGEITVTELNRRISEYASSHAEELARSGVLNMTYYSESLSLFKFLLEREGKPFVRALVQRLRGGATMEEIIRERSSYSNGIRSLEEEWVRWVQAGPK